MDNKSKPVKILETNPNHMMAYPRYTCSEIVNKQYTQQRESRPNPIIGNPKVKKVVANLSWRQPTYYLKMQRKRHGHTDQNLDVNLWCWGRKGNYPVNNLMNAQQHAKCSGGMKNKAVEGKIEPQKGLGGDIGVHIKWKWIFGG